VGEERDQRERTDLSTNASLVALRGLSCEWRIKAHLKMKNLVILGSFASSCYITGFYTDTEFLSLFARALVEAPRPTLRKQTCCWGKQGTDAGFHWWLHLNQCFSNVAVNTSPGSPAFLSGLPNN
jgi:hypothetical protein